MFNRARGTLLALILCMSQLTLPDNIITFFIRPYPTGDTMTEVEFKHIIQSPGKLARELLRSMVEVGHYQGVIASYMGYITVSDFSGQITFPRLHQLPTIRLLVTPMVEPVMMLGATVHHLELLSSLPAQMYLIDRRQDPETELFYWNVEPTESPQNKRIPLDTIILFTKPSNIKVPSGITLTDNSNMLVLPDIYATQELNVPIEALRVLKIRNFFGPVQFNTKEQTPVDIVKQLVP